MTSEQTLQDACLPDLTAEQATMELTARLQVTGLGAVSNREQYLESSGTVGTMAESDRPAPPTRVEVTAKFIAENRAKQRAYEDRRRLWTEPLQPLRSRAQAAASSRGRGKINDPRQHKFDL